MPKLFISYRRGDCGDVTWRLHDHLKAHFGDGSIFLDEDGIPPGLDFREYIDKQLKSCDVLLAVIGETWAKAADANGGRRLDDSNDWVRIEIETALSRDIPVIPLLVGKAALPDASELPGKLNDLLHRQAANVGKGAEFNNDVQQLIERLNRLFADRNDANQTSNGSPSGDSRKRPWFAVGAILLGLVLIAFFTYRWWANNATQPMPDQVEPVATARSGIEPATTLSVAAPLRVISFDVQHFANMGNVDEDKGWALGKESFSPHRHDKLQFKAKLSRPAYAFIIAFRPDSNVPELCFPDHKSEVPPLTDSPRYPWSDATKAYGLDEGAGLWVFAIAATDKPVTYRQWLADREPNWPKGLNEAGTIWLYDGADVVETVTSHTRSKDVELKGPAATVRSLGRWLASSQVTAVNVIGFGVTERK